MIITRYTSHPRGTLVHVVDGAGREIDLPVVSIDTETHTIRVALPVKDESAAHKTKGYAVAGTMRRLDFSVHAAGLFWRAGETGKPYPI